MKDVINPGQDVYSRVFFGVFFRVPGGKSRWPVGLTGRRVIGIERMSAEDALPAIGHALRYGRSIGGDDLAFTPDQRIDLPPGIINTVVRSQDTHGTQDSSRLTPGRYARRSKASIVVTYLRRYRPPDLERLGKTSFLGQSAYEGMQVIRPWTFDDGARSEYTLYLTHDGDWYEIRYGIAEERTQLPGEVRQYLNTLRWEEAASHIVSPITEPEQ